MTLLDIIVNQTLHCCHMTLHVGDSLTAQCVDCKAPRIAHFSALIIVNTIIISTRGEGQCCVLFQVSLSSKRINSVQHRDGTVSLQLNDLLESDAGSYRCTAVLPDGTEIHTSTQLSLTKGRILLILWFFAVIHSVQSVIYVLDGRVRKIFSKENQ